MKYANGRPAQIKDNVLAIGPSGPFIGRLVGMDSTHLQVVPLYSQSAVTLLPSAVNLLTDALLPEIKPFAPAAA